MNSYYISTSFANSRITFEMCLVENTAKKLCFKELWGDKLMYSMHSNREPFHKMNEERTYNH